MICVLIDMTDVGKQTISKIMIDKQLNIYVYDAK